MFSGLGVHDLDDGIAKTGGGDGLMAGQPKVAVLLGDGVGTAVILWAGTVIEIVRGVKEVMLPLIAVTMVLLLTFPVMAEDVELLLVLGTASVGF